MIVGKKKKQHLTDLQHTWRRIRAQAMLDDVRIHDLRHTLVSGGLQVGEGLSMIGKLLGHTQVQTTARYAHLASDPVKQAADKISERLAAALFAISQDSSESSAISETQTTSERQGSKSASDRHPRLSRSARGIGAASG